MQMMLMLTVCVVTQSPWSRLGFLRKQRPSGTHPLEINARNYANTLEQTEPHESPA